MYNNILKWKYFMQAFLVQASVDTERNFDYMAGHIGVRLEDL